VLRNKPVAVMGAVLGQSGSANAQATLRGVLGRIGAIVAPDTQVLVPHASRLFDEHVDLRDEGTFEEIRHLVDAVALVPACAARRARQRTVGDWSVASAARSRRGPRRWGTWSRLSQPVGWCRQTTRPILLQRVCYC